MHKNSIRKYLFFFEIVSSWMQIIRDKQIFFTFMRALKHNVTKRLRIVGTGLKLLNSSEIS